MLTAAAAPAGVSLVSPSSFLNRRSIVLVIAIAWAPGTGELLGGDPGIEVVAPDGSELGDRIIEALRTLPRRPDGPPGGDARLEATA